MWLTLWRKKVFVLIFIPFYWFDQKHLFKQIQIFLWIYPFSNMVRKTNFLSFSVIVFDSVTFVSKKNSFLWISPKIIKTTERQFSSVWLTLWRKRAFVNIYPILLVLLKKFFKTRERHSLAVCAALCGEKHFLLIFIPFYWFVPQKLFKQIQIFIRICPYQIW